MMPILHFLEQRWGDAANVAMDRLRATLLRLRGANLGAKSRVGRGCIVQRPWRLTTGARVQVEHGVHIKIVNDGARLNVGKETFIGFGTELDVACEVIIGHHVLIAPGCFITDHAHRHHESTSIAQQGSDSRLVRIGNDVWLGAHSVVLAGVTIADGAVVGAGAVVTRNVPPYTIVAGVPARPIGQRERPL